MPQKQGIPFEQFKLFCTSGFKYTGDVHDFGYVYWITETVPLKLPDDYPLLPNHTKVTYITVSRLKVTPYAKAPLMVFGQPFSEEHQIQQQKEKTEYERFQQLMASLLTAVNTMNSVNGIAKTYQSSSTIPVTLGSKYIKINEGGTLVRNPNRVYTTEGKLATKAGRRIFWTGVIIDAALVATGEQTIEDAAINTGINAGILIIGHFCPPLGVALGVTYLIYSFIDKPNIGYIPSYEELHGSIAPADNTRVHNPYKR